jgi:hypothetical protein
MPLFGGRIDLMKSMAEVFGAIGSVWAGNLEV